MVDLNPSPDASTVPKPIGFIEHAVRAWRVWRTERHYRSVLSAEVRDSLHRLVGAGNEGSNEHNGSKLLDVVAPDFPQTMRPHLKQLEEHVESTVRRAATNVINDLRPVIDLNVRTIDDLQAEVVDSRNSANATHELADPPALEPVDEDHIQKLKLLVYHRAQRLRRRIAAAAAFMFSGIAVTTEGTLVYASLLPVFGGVTGIAGWMLPLQAVVITMGMLFLAHQSRRSSGTNTDWRWISRASLCLVALALAGLRAGILVVHEGSTAGVPASIESWGLLLLVFLAGVVLAVFGAAAYERATQLLRQADEPWTGSQGNLVALEAAVAAAEKRHRGRQVFERRRREFYTRAVHRTRQLENELRRSHRVTQGLLQGEMRRVLTCLAPVVRQASRCLARWRHNAGSSQDMAPAREPRLLAPLLVLGVGLLGANCGLDRQTPVEHHVLLDTSGSMSAEILARIQEQVLEQTRTWVRTAPSGSALTIWWLSSEGAPYPAQRMTLKMPPLEVPAHRHRQRIVQHFEHEVSEVFEQFPRAVRRTRLLESLFYIGSTADGQWQLTIYSDLQQDSENWDTVRRRLEVLPDDDVVTQMLAICPPIAVPPSEVMLRTWPGLVTARRAGIHEHQRYRTLFQAFFSHWAPSASVRMGAI